MALEDFMDAEVGIAVAATAAVMSPRVRGALRRGAVLGLAGLFKAGDTVSTAARGMANQAQQTAGDAAATAHQTAAEARATARGGKGAQAG